MVRIYNIDLVSCRHLEGGLVDIVLEAKGFCSSSKDAILEVAATSPVVLTDAVWVWKLKSELF